MSAQLAVSRHLLSVRMTEAGIFAEDQPIELINGELFDMAPIGSFHADIIDRLTQLFYKKASDKFRIRVQNPIYLSEVSEPKPDIALVKNHNDRLLHPTADDVLLLIEVADSSLHYDRTIKLPLYASHQIPEVWLLNVKEQRLDIYQQPENDYYRLHLRPKSGESIQPLLVDAVSVDWSALLDY